MGTTYAKVFWEVPGARPVAVAGGSRAADLAARFRLEAVPSMDALLVRRDLDAVVITTPHFAHAGEAVAALRTGKHVLIEKPMATTVADCDRIVRAAGRRGLVAAVGYHQRFRTVNRKAREVVRSGVLGRPLSFYATAISGGGFGKGWKRDPRSVGNFLGYGCHTVDLLAWAFDDDIVSVDALAGAWRDEGPNETLTNALLRFRSGLAGTLLATTILPRPGFPEGTTLVRVIAEKGIMDWRSTSGLPGSLSIGVEGRDAALRMLHEEPALQFSGNGMLAENRTRAYRDLARDFVSAIRCGARPSADASAGRRTVAICLAAMESSRRRAAVRIR